MSATLAVLFLLASSDDAADIDKRLEAGEVIITTEKVAGSDLPRAIAVGLIEAPPERVWAIIEDCSKYAKTMVRIEKSELLERDGGTMVCRVTADLPFPLPNLTGETRAVHTIEPGVRYERRWTLIKGDYRMNSGAWVITPWKGDPKRTHARYELHVDPKIHVPDSFITSGQKKSLPDLFAKLREQTVGK